MAVAAFPGEEFQEMFSLMRISSKVKCQVCVADVGARKCLAALLWMLTQTFTSPEETKALILSIGSTKIP
jgi:hypothetical protein